LAKLHQEVQNIFQRINEASCPICLNDFDAEECIKTVVQCCKNVFCMSCLSFQMSNNNLCPMCRTLIDINAIAILKPDDAEGGEEEPVESVVIEEVLEDTRDSENKKSGDVLKKIRHKKAKLDCMSDILDKIMGINRESKIIIFSDFAAIFKQIQAVLRQKRIVFEELDGGNIANIDRTVGQYKNGNVSVLMVNSLIYGSGLNLANTTD